MPQLLLTYALYGDSAADDFGNTMFQLYLIVIASFIEIVHIFAFMFSKWSAADLPYTCEKGLILQKIILFYFHSIQMQLNNKKKEA